MLDKTRIVSLFLNSFNKFNNTFTLYVFYSFWVSGLVIMPSKDLSNFSSGGHFLTESNNDYKAMLEEYIIMIMEEHLCEILFLTTDALVIFRTLFQHLDPENERKAG